MNVSPNEFKDILSKYKKYTVYGLSPDPAKTSHNVTEHMKGFGYDIRGTHPLGDSLADIPQEHKKMINVFRRSESLPDVVREILNLIGVEVVWFQLGISHPHAEKKLEDAGIKVISNHCIYVEYKKAMGV